MITLATDYADQINKAFSNALSTGIIIYIILLVISLAIFAIHVAVATIVVKKIWYSDIGGRPMYYR